MWWFRRDGKSKKGRKAKPAPKKAARKADRGQPKFGWRDAWPIVGTFLALATVGGLLWGWWRYRPELMQYAAARHEAVRIVEFTDVPTRVEGVGPMLRDQALVRLGADPFDAGSIERVRELIERSGWFEPGVRVRRDLSRDESGTLVDRVLIEGTFRRPFALVRAGNVDCLVDRNAVRLDAMYTANQVTIVPVIVGAAAPAPAVGRTWPGGDVADGLALVAYLGRSNPPWLNQVREIDVSNADGRDRRRPRLMLRTVEGYPIAWGRAVGDEGGVEVPAERKLEMLNNFYLEHGRRIGSPQGMIRVNIEPPTLEPMGG